MSKVLFERAESAKTIALHIEKVQVRYKSRYYHIRECGYIFFKDNIFPTNGDKRVKHFIYNQLTQHKLLSENSAISFIYKNYRSG